MNGKYYCGECHNSFSSPMFRSMCPFCGSGNYALGIELCGLTKRVIGEPKVKFSYLKKMSNSKHKNNVANDDILI